MTTFTNGPAKGATLMLHRTPLLLRVTETKGVFDALNELEDVAKPEEKLFCYVMSKYSGAVHINRGRGRGGFYPMAEYTLREVQPDDAVMRSNESWSAWCDSSPEAKLLECSGNIEFRGRIKL